MKVEYLKSFSQAINSFFSELNENKIDMGEINLIQTDFIIEDASVIIGFVGDIKGQAFFTMNETFAKNITSVLLGGMEVVKMDELVKSSVGEVGNMIMGKACTIISEKGINIDITSPTILCSEKVCVNNFEPTYSFPINVENIGNLNFNVAIIDNNT
jgi:chemotaxis protein CheX